MKVQHESAPKQPPTVQGAVEGQATPAAGSGVEAGEASELGEVAPGSIEGGAEKAQGCEATAPVNGFKRTMWGF